LKSIAVASLKREELFSDTESPETGRPFTSFSEYVQFRFSDNDEEEETELDRKKIHRYAKIGEVYLDNKELFIRKEFDPYGHVSKLLFWEDAVKNHPEKSASEIYDAMIASDKRSFENYAKGDGPVAEVSTHVHSVMFDSSLALYTQCGSLSFIVAQNLDDGKGADADD
jgi:hypothetical protein